MHVRLIEVVSAEARCEDSLYGSPTLTAIVVDLNQEFQEFNGKGNIVWERFETEFKNLGGNVRIGVAMIFHASCA